MMPTSKKIFVDTTSVRAWTNRIPRQISRTGVDGNTPEKIGHACSISETSSPALIGIIGTTAPPCGLNVSPYIHNIWKSATPDFRKSNKLDTSVDQQFTDNLVAPPIFTEVICDKLSYSSIQDLYTCCWMNLVADLVNVPARKFVDLGLSTINVLGKGASLWTPTTRVGRPTDVARGSAPYHIFEKLQQLEML